MDDVTNATNEPSRHSETPRRTRRGGKRIRLKNAPKPAMVEKALWEQASAEDKERAKRQGAAILELWLGRKSKEALHYLVAVKETLGDAWLTPDLFRFGASSLLTDVTLQLAKLRDGNYQSEDYFSIA